MEHGWSQAHKTTRILCVECSGIGLDLGNENGLMSRNGDEGTGGVANYPFQYIPKDSFELLQHSASRGCQFCTFIARNFLNAEEHRDMVLLARTYLDLPRVRVTIDGEFRENTPLQISTTYDETLIFPHGREQRSQGDPAVSDPQIEFRNVASYSS